MFSSTRCRTMFATHCKTVAGTSFSVHNSFSVTTSDSCTHLRPPANPELMASIDAMESGLALTPEVGQSGPTESVGLQQAPTPQAASADTVLEVRSEAGQPRAAAQVSTACGPPSRLPCRSPLKDAGGSLGSSSKSVQVTRTKTYIVNPIPDPRALALCYPDPKRPLPLSPTLLLYPTPTPTLPLPYAYTLE